MTHVPRRVALTGGIATGKSYCLGRFAALGVPTIDADVLARDAVAPGSAGLAAIVDRFGTGILDRPGVLDRAALARLVFADATARAQLEAIVHPRVYAAISTWFAGLRGVPLGVADVPLLFETGHQDDFDRVVAAWCPVESQVKRLAARGLSPDDIERRLASQWPADAKARHADFVIDTSGSFDETDRQIDRIARDLAA